MRLLISRFFLLLGLCLPALAPAVTPMVAAGIDHTVALKSDGTMVAWGFNGNGQLGDGTTIDSLSPAVVPGLTGVVAVTTGDSHVVALKSDGTMLAWGLNNIGQLGDGTTTQQLSPVPVPGVTGVVAVSASFAHTVALKSDGTVVAWGKNIYGGLGDGTTTDRHSPVAVTGLTGVVAVTGGQLYTVALKSDGSLVAWGDNSSGQLGDGTTTERHSPVAVPGLTGVVAVAVGGAHTVVLKSDGTVMAWGSNVRGQLGDGTTTQRLNPVAVPGLTGVVAVDAGSGHTVALKSDGTVVTWGWNLYGQLGDGTTTQRLSPAVVQGLTGVMAVVAAPDHTVAIKSDGTVMAWGINGSGQLGDGTITQRNSPVTVTGLNLGLTTSTTSSLSPTSLTFVEQNVGSSSVAQTLTLTNTGSDLLDITSIISSGDYARTTTCGTNLAAGANCAINVTFTPTAAGGRNGSINIASSTASSLYTVSLSGTGISIPNAPVIGSATSGNTQAIVSFTAPVSDGGSAITGYTVTSSPAGGTDSNTGTTGLSHTITGLTNSTAYTFTVNAINAVGSSAASAPSNAVTPYATPPSAFIFTPQSNVAASALATSNPITVAGIAAQSPISPISIASCDSTQCEYKINNGAWTNAPGFVSNGNTVQVRLLTGAYATENHLALDIGGVMGFFTASTPGAPATVKFAAPAYSVVAGTPTVVLSVTRTGGTGVASVAYATANGTATAELDYTAKTGTLSWLAGDTTAKTITVPILNPASGINKTFGVSLSNSSGAALSVPASVTVTILDRNNTVQFNPATLSVSEAAGAAVLTVSRSGSTAGAVSVNYVTANGTALTGSDYLASSGTLNWNDGDGADKTISVPVINDSMTEAAETFNVTLSNPVGALLGTAKTATVTIADGDSAIQFSVASASVAENVVSGNITLLVTRTGTSTGAASATYSSADGVATAGSDYTATSGTLNWGAGDATAKTITVPILNDSVVEGSETFKVNLTSAVGATLGANKAVTVTITDNDTGAGVLQFSASNYVFKENGVNALLAATRTSGSPGALLTVTRTGGSLGAVSVTYATTPGTATAGADYTSKTGALSWLTGDVAAKTILVPIINDIVAEPTETFTIDLTNATGGATLGAVNAATVSIIDDDTPAVVGIQFDTRKYTVLENAGVATLTVNRDPANAANAAMVSYATSNGTAMVAADFLATSGTLNWSAGDSTPRTITVPIIDNTVAEVTKSFNVTLSNAAGNTLGATPVATVTIIDDDEIFPPGGQTPAGWSMPVAADRGWYVSWGQFQAGVASLRSGNVLDGQKAQTEVTRNFQNGMVSFSLRVSSETNADYLRFYIDGVKKGEWSGIQTLWTTVNYPLVAGSHTLRWSYEKDGSLMAGADGAWIDTVSLPAEQ